jgi:hypothetical protein
MSEKKGEEAKKEDGEEEEASKSKEKMRVTKPAAGKKRAVKKPKAQESEADEASSEDEFDPGNTSPTPSKRRGAKSLTFAESALATATRTPPATRASRKFAQTYRAPSLSSESVDPQTSPPHQLSNLEPTDLLYQFGVKGYDEPLLGRREPVMSSPVALLPKSMDPSATPRATADEHYQKIQAKTLEKLQARQKGNLAMAQEQAMNEIPAQRVSLDYSDVLLEIQTDLARTRMKMTGTHTLFARTLNLRLPSTTMPQWTKTTTGRYSTRWKALR